jgi:hypothetical protein
MRPVRSYDAQIFGRQRPGDAATGLRRACQTTREVRAVPNLCWQNGPNGETLRPPLLEASSHWLWGT